MAGGPNERRDASESQITEKRCPKCNFYEQLDRDYLGYVKHGLNRAIDRAQDEQIPDFDVSEDDSDNENDDVWKTNHNYHLAWAVFKHLPGMNRVSSSYLWVFTFCHNPIQCNYLLSPQIESRTVP